MKINYRKIVLPFLIAIQVIWYIALYRNSFSLPFLGKVDFIIYYTAGKVAQQYGFSEVYNIAKQQEVQAELSNGKQWFEGGVLPFNHPPYLLPVLNEVIGDDYVSSYIRWELFLFAFVAACWFISARLFRKIGFNNAHSAAVVGSLILFYPIWISLLIGHDTIVLLFALLAWAYGVINDNDTLAGLALSLATIRPQIALLLVIPFLWRRRGVFIWFSLGVAILITYSVILIGFDGIVGFIQMIVLTANGESYGIHPAAMVNLYGLILRTFSSVRIIDLRVWVWAAYFLAIIALCVIWYRAKTIDVRLIGVSTLVAVLVSPHLHYHDLAVLVIPLLCAVYSKHANEFVVSMLSVFLIVADPTPMRGYMSYIIIVIIFVLLWKNEIMEISGRFIKKLPITYRIGG
jgi:hypothetical protein